MDENLNLPWKIIDKYFRDNPHSLVNHQLDSYNAFFHNGINQIFRENNPIQINKLYDDKLHKYGLSSKLYLGGKDGNKIYYGKPIIYDEQGTQYMYPNDARLRNMSYGMTVHYDVDVDFFIDTEEGEPIQKSITLEKM